MDEETLHELMYTLRKKFYNKHDIIQNPGDDASTLLFIQAGCIEIYTMCEGHFFLLERLFRGSCINFRTFFMEYEGVVHIRCASNSIMLELDYDVMVQ